MFAKNFSGLLEPRKVSEKNLILHLIPLIFSFPILIEAWGRKFRNSFGLIKEKKSKGKIP